MDTQKGVPVNQTFWGEAIRYSRVTEATELNENNEEAWRSEKHLGRSSEEQQHLKGRGKPLNPTGDPGKG